MMATTILLSLAVIACKPHKPSDNAEVIQVSDYTNDAIVWADSVASAMTDDELIGQLIMPAVYSRVDSFNVSLIRHYIDSLHLGGILFLQGDTASAKHLARMIRTQSRVTPFVAIDAEWGLGMRFPQMPSYTPFGKLPDSISDVNLYDYGYEIGRQAPGVGVNTVFAPVLDVASAVQSSIGFRSFGKNPHRVAELGTSFARGLEDGGVISVAKHFPGLGSAQVDTHLRQPLITRSREEVDSIDLYPFRRFIQMELSGIMIGHVAMTAIDTIVRSAAVSPVVMTDLLRKEMGFKGVIFTDAFNMKGLGAIDRPILHAILAGANVVVAPDDTDAAIAELKTSLEAGALTREILLERVSRTLFYKFRLN